MQYATCRVGVAHQKLGTQKYPELLRLQLGVISLPCAVVIKRYLCVSNRENRDGTAITCIVHRGKMKCLIKRNEHNWGFLEYRVITGSTTSNVQKNTICSTLFLHVLSKCS